MDEIRFEVIKDRSYDLRFPPSRIVPQWLIYVAGINGVFILTFAFTPLEKPTVFEYANSAIGIIGMIYLLRVALAFVVVETEYKFRLTSSKKKLIDKLSVFDG